MSFFRKKPKKDDSPALFLCYFCNANVVKKGHEKWCVRHPDNKPKKN